MGAGLGLAALLGIGLLLASFARLAGDVGSAAFDVDIVRTALTDPLWHTRLGLNSRCSPSPCWACTGFGLLCWLLAWSTGKAFPPTLPSSPVGGHLVPGGAAGCCSPTRTLRAFSLGEPYHAAANAPLLGTTPFMLVTVCLLACLAAVLGMFSTGSQVAHGSYLLAAGVAVAASAGFAWNHGAHHRDQAARAPNIFLLGIDSLRPDFIDPQVTPHVHAFLANAVQMQDAVTPLARTFPPWISILTGRHPHTTGAYMNLLPRKLIQEGTTLPHLLRGHGYRSYYAMDETRFANIDASYGFDQTMTATIGGSDFVISWFADTPLSNMVMNTWLGALLFPHAHANRAAHVTYDPDTFVRRVAGGLDASQPAFLAWHCHSAALALQLGSHRLRQASGRRHR